MDTGDIEMPSPKRQKTESPTPNRPEEIDPSQPSIEVGLKSSREPQNSSTSIPGLTLNPLPDQNLDEPRDVLDFLMQHVESEAAAEMQVEERKEVANTTNEALLLDLDPPQPQEILSEVVNKTSIDGRPEPSRVVDVQSNVELQSATTASHKLADAEQMAITPAEPLQPTEQEITQSLDAVAEVDGLPAPSSNTQSETEPPTTSDPSIQAREWETDSSPYESSSTETDSSDSSDDSSDDLEEGDEYTLLDPYEQARILMAESGGGGSDDEEDGHSVNRASRPGGGAGLRTTNEKAEDILPKPSIVVTENMHIEELGTVEAIVENTLLIRAKISGEYQVLESGSVLCLADRSVVGAVAETLGRVEQPMYTVRFASVTDIEEAGLNERGTKIYYVKEHSTFVFTQPLQGVKGSDASNFHDEEVGDDEMEFSDDEAEAEHKRQMKLRRKGIDPDSVPAGSRGRGRGKDRGGRGRANGQRGGYNNSPRAPSFDTDSGAYVNNGSDVAMNYDDVEQGESSYTPLKRPETMTAAGAMSPPTSNYSASSFSRQQNNSQSGSSRGGYERHQNRSRGRGNFNNNRGRGRGNYNNHSNNNTPAASPYDQKYATAAQNLFPYSPNTSGYNDNNNQNSSNFNFQPPPPPALTPTNQNTFPGNTFSPSPITPLPGGSFNFPTFPNFNMNMNMSQWPQAQQPLQQTAYGGHNNAEAIAQVQRQLEELRRYGANDTQR